MNDLKEILVRPELSVKDAIENMGASGRRVVVVVDAAFKFHGIFTDGDMRRYILKGGNLGVPICEAMNRSPYVLPVGCTHDDLQRCFVERNRFLCPLVDDRGRLREVVFRDEYSDKLENFVMPQLPDGVETVIMAGGLGKRLYPYTKVLPKALIPIGDKPILTHVIDKFKSFGCRKFHLIVNHKRNLIKAYYAEEDSGCQLVYHDEEKPLGPAGGLCYLKGCMDKAFFLSNCDILVDADYAEIYAFHKREGNLITAVGALRQVEVPYGVIEIGGNGSAIKAISEKPTSTYLANVGVYVLEPAVLDDIEDQKVLLITDLITRYIAEGRRVGVYPVAGGAWQDMGQLDEMKKMERSLEERLSCK